MPGESIVVTGIGMQSAVGYHAMQTATSVRAGLNRFTEWKHFGVDDAGIVASWIPPNLGDCSWCEKFLDLARAPLTEALWRARLWEFPYLLPRSRRPARIQALLGTPPSERPGVTPDEHREFAETIAEELFSETTPPVALLPHEHASGVMAVASACELLQRGDCDICVVGAADSLLDSVFLQALLEEGRLKASNTSSGIIPGEAAAFLVLERESQARQRGAPPLVCIDAVGLEREEPWRQDAPVGGRGMTRALRSVLDAVGGAGEFGHVFCDLNGERWRFLEWALVEARCLGGLPRGRRLWHPADCLGDVGAAFGPVAVGLAIHAFQRGYAAKPRILITAASARGERAALSVSRPEER